MSRLAWVRVVVAVILCLWFAGLYWYSRPVSPSQNEVICSFQSDCLFAWGDNPKAQLKLIGAPSPLTPFSVEITGVDAPNLTIAFAMKDMEMGSNSFVLKRLNSGAWGERVVLPICTQKRHDWRITIYNEQHAVVITTYLESGAHP